MEISRKLYRPCRELVDSITYPRMYENISYGVSLNNEYLFFRRPSPGKENLNSREFRISGEVEFDPPAGVYSPGVGIFIRPKGTSGIIRYTLDGSEPEKDDPEFKKELFANRSMVFRARLWSEGAEPGETGELRVFQSGR